MPFLTTLRQTDFIGDIGIINYGLSEQKIAILEQENCKIFQPAKRYPELLLDRFASVAEIAAEHHYQQLALLDADIWFPAPHFSLFSQVQESEKLYCAFDVWHCTFLYDCINPTIIPEVKNKINSLLQKNGHIWQAAVCVADKQGWANYLAYLEQRLTPPHHFLFKYGIDATLMNLYAAETDNVAHLPKKYNALPPWGIECRNDGSGIQHYIDNERVECLHITRNHRSDKLMAYPKLYPQTYFNQLKHFSGGSTPFWRITKESITQTYAHLYSEHCQTLKLDFAKANKLITDFKEQDSLVLIVAGESVISLQNPHSSSVTFNFKATTYADQPVVKNMYFCQQGGENGLALNVRYMATIAPNESIQFITREIDIERSLSWVFYGLRLID